MFSLLAVLFTIHQLAYPVRYTGTREEMYSVSQKKFTLLFLWLLGQMLTDLIHSSATLLDMQSAVIATAIPSVRPSVRLSVTRW